MRRTYIVAKTSTVLLGSAVVNRMLLAQCMAVHTLGEAIKLGLQSTKAARFVRGVFSIEFFENPFPLPAKVNTMVPNEMHFLFLALLSVQSSALCPPRMQARP